MSVPQNLDVPATIRTRWPGRNVTAHDGRRGSAERFGIRFVHETRHELTRDAVAASDVGQGLTFRVQDLEEETLGIVPAALQCRERVGEVRAERLWLHHPFEITEWTTALDQITCDGARVARVDERGDCPFARAFDEVERVHVALPQLSDVGTDGFDGHGTHS